MDNTPWFEKWFDTTYYHTLYQHRNEQEAAQFIKNLTDYLQLEKKSTVLDLACGKGRHAYFLAQQGFKVTGVDLSKHSIETAKEHYKLPNLHFEIKDMRNPLQQSFDAIFNLFTSFGYFENLDDNIRVLNATKAMLNTNGIVVIDFLNAKKVIQNLVPNEVKTIDNIQFFISRSIENNCVVKRINFEDKGKQFAFKESVQLLDLDDFNTLISRVGFTIQNTFGNYNLDKFDDKHSDRLILILKQSNG